MVNLQPSHQQPPPPSPPSPFVLFPISPPSFQSLPISTSLSIHFGAVWYLEKFISIWNSHWSNPLFSSFSTTPHNNPTKQFTSIFNSYPISVVVNTTSNPPHRHHPKPINANHNPDDFIPPLSTPFQNAHPFAKIYFSIPPPFDFLTPSPTLNFNSPIIINHRN